jgi:hypothetical protein
MMNQFDWEGLVFEAKERRKKDISDPLHESVAKLVHGFLKELYARFGFYEPQYEFIEEELREMFSRKV